LQASPGLCEHHIVERTGAGCPSDEEVARFVEGKQSSDEHARLQAHLDGCDACRALVAGAASPSDVVLSPAEATTLPAWAETPRLGRGALVDRYVIIDFVGEGGMGAVYSAFDPELGRRIALKLLRTAEPTAERRALLLREAQVLARFSHPNVATIHDAGTFGEHVFLAMELVDGGTLRSWLDGGARPWREAVALLAAAGEGLAAAHRAGLVHRDFKPENVLLGSDGRPRVTDFGLAGPTGASAGRMMGTPAYMAPEQMAGAASDARADLFSFCVALYEALYGMRPFAGDSVSAVGESIRTGAVRPPPRDRAVPAWLRRLVLSGLAVDPAARPASMDALLVGLRADPERRRRRWLAVAGLAIAAASSSVIVERAIAARAASCSGAAALLDGTWDAARREAMHAAFVKSGLPYAEGSFAGAARLLDAYAHQWTVMRTDACEATRVRRTQPAETMALRVACLDDRRRELRALTDVLVAADRDTVEHAGGAASALSRVEGCADVAALAAPVPRPHDPAQRARLDAALAQADRAEVLVRTGKADQAAPLATAALAELRAVGHAPSEGYAASVLSDADQRLGRLDQAIVDCDEALCAGQRGRDDQRVLFALDGLTEMFALTGRADEGLRYARLALATAERLGSDAKFVIDAKSARSMALVAAGRLDEALADKREVIAAWEKRYGPNHMFVIEGRSNVGIILTGQGRIEEARAAFAEALASLDRLLGAANPETLPAKNNLGSALLLLGRIDEAAAVLEPALAEAARAFGEDTPSYAITLTNVGELRLAQGRFDEALAIERRALAILERLGRDHSGLCEPLTQVGLALIGLGRPSEAVAPLERALAIGKARAIAPTELARVQVALARALASSHSDLTRARALQTSAHTAFLEAARRWGGENDRFADEIAHALQH
jgi:tetratricopeptide (TPR) repeat protein